MAEADVMKAIEGLREKMEKNQQVKEALEKEPKKVIAKSYFQGEPSDLINITNPMFNSLKPKKTGEQAKCYAVTMMIEEITPKTS
jgi:hypothetical protein